MNPSVNKTGFGLFICPITSDASNLTISISVVVKYSTTSNSALIIIPESKFANASFAALTDL